MTGRTTSALVALALVLGGSSVFAAPAVAEDGSTPTPTDTAVTDTSTATADPSAAPSATSTASDPAPAVPREDYLVTFTDASTAAERDAALAAAGAVVVSSVPALSLVVVSLDAGGLDTLRADGHVVRVESDKTREVQATPSDPSYADQWSLPQIGWDSVFGSTQLSGNSTVAVLDTGVDVTGDLQGRVLEGASMLDLVADTADGNGHGTAMASIVAAGVDNGAGIAGVGLDAVSVLPVKVLGADGTGQDSDIVEGVVYAADHGADVILMSFSNPGRSYALQAAVDYAWSTGAVIVAATGNEGSSADTFPAGLAKVVGVSATNRSDELWTGSNYGADTFLAAPGVDIATGNGSVTGTSASAAVVAGSAALLAADSAASNGVIVGRLARNADPAGTVDQTGNGRVNLARALADTSTAPVVPQGVAGNSGPVVGPYVASAVNDGDGSMTVTPSTAAAGSTGNTFTFTFTVAGTSGNMNGGSVTLEVPTGWTAPQTTSASSAGFISDPGSLGTCKVSSRTVASRTVTFAIATGAGGGCSTGQSFSVTYGGATAPSTTGVSTFTTKTKASANAGSLVSISNQPTVTVGSSCAAAAVQAQPSAQSITYGADATFSAAASGSPAPTTQWQISTNAGSTWNNIPGGTSSTLTLTKPGVSLSGNLYRAVFTNTCSGTQTATTNQVGLTVAAKNLTISGTAANNKVYDASTGATVNFTGASLVGVVAGDTVTINSAGYAASFANKTVGTNKPVTVTGVALGGGDAANYTVSQPSGLTANITALGLTVSGITAASKTYDGGTSATLNTLDAVLVGRQGGDDVVLSTSGASGAFATSGVGTGKTVQVSGLTISGGDSENYTLAQPSSTANISARNLTVSGAVANDKPYDALTAATVDVSSASLVGVVGSESVSIDSSGYAASFADKNVGTNKPVTVTGITLGGADAGNYTVSQPSDLTANITALGLTVSGITAANKVYDGTTTATLNVSAATLVGVRSGDSTSLSTIGSTGAFDTAAAGTGKAVQVSGLSIFGTDSGNYTLAQPATTADITKKTLTVTAADDAKIYGSANPSPLGFSYSDDFVGTDTAGDINTAPTCSTTATLTSPVASYPITCSGAADNNYAFSYQAGTLTVGKATSSIVVAAASSSYSEQSVSVSLNATVSNESNAAAVDGGSVTFQVTDGATNVGTAVTDSSVVGGAASVSYSLPAGTVVGEYTIVVTYTPSGNFTGSSDDIHKLTVGKRSTSTVAAPQSSTYSEQSVNVTLGATVSATGSSVNAGSVTFQVTDGVTNVGTAVTDSSVVGGAASVSYSLPAGTVVGEYTIVVTYTPSGNFTGSSDDIHKLTVGKRSTSTVAVNQTAVYGNTTVPLAATVSATGSSVNDGSVTFQLKNGLGNVGSPVTDSSVVAGAASVTYVLPAGAVGSYTIVATYNPSVNFSGSYDSTKVVSILYAWGGFLQPINDTAHMQLGTAESKFKSGQTIPVKFEIKDAAGNLVRQTTDPAFRWERRSGCTGDTVSETVLTVSPMNGTTYSWSGSQYQYNWSTKGLGAGGYRVFADLADGSAQYVDICLTK